MILQERERQVIRQRLAGLASPIRLINFTQELECDTCRETRQLLEETAALSDMVTFEVYNFQTDRDQRDAFGIDKIPATVVMGEKDYGIRYYGVPSGYEFASLLETMLLVASGDSGLAPATRARLAQLEKPLHLEVFVTPT